MPGSRGSILFTISGLAQAPALLRNPPPEDHALSDSSLCLELSSQAQLEAALQGVHVSVEVRPESSWVPQTEP